MIKHIPFLLETKITENGGILSSTDTTLPCVNVDERIVTGQNSASCEDVAIEMLSLMKVGAVKK